MVPSDRSVSRTGLVGVPGRRKRLLLPRKRLPLGGFTERTLNSRQPTAELNRSSVFTLTEKFLLLIQGRTCQHREKKKIKDRVLRRNLA